MNVFTYMSDEGIDAILLNQRILFELGETFDFTLNAREYNLFRKALDFVVDNHPNEDLSAWAEIFTLGMHSPEFSLDYPTFENVVYALRWVWYRDIFAPIVDGTKLSEWSGEFLSSVAESQEIEFI